MASKQPHLTAEQRSMLLDLVGQVDPAEVVRCVANVASFEYDLEHRDAVMKAAAKLAKLVNENPLNK